MKAVKDGSIILHFERPTRERVPKVIERPGACRDRNHRINQVSQVTGNSSDPKQCINTPDVSKCTLNGPSTLAGASLVFMKSESDLRSCEATQASCKESPPKIMWLQWDISNFSDFFLIYIIQCIHIISLLLLLLLLFISTQYNYNTI